MTHILIATDGSEPSLAAARLVRALCNPAAVAGVTVLAVVEPVETATFYAGADDVLAPEAWAEATGAAERAARDAATRTAATVARPVPPVTTIIRYGAAAEEIARCAEEIGAGLIAVGGRGWGWDEGGATLLGRVSERLLRIAPCAVLVTYPPYESSVSPRPW